MNLPKLRSQRPGQAYVLICGCRDEFTASLSQAVLKLGHRAFLWEAENSPPELITDGIWNVALCGPNLTTEQINLLAGSASDYSRILWTSESEIPSAIADLAEEFPLNGQNDQQLFAIHHSVEVSLMHEQRNDWRSRFTRQLFRDLVCDSDAMHALQEQILQVAHQNVPLLLLGHPGSDDRTLVWTLHQSGSRSNAPCLTLDCESYSSTAFEQELFNDRTSDDGMISPLIEQIDGGTLLLKNPQSLSQSVQKKLIRFLESPAITRPESHSLRYINLRWCFSFPAEHWPSRQSPLGLYLQERHDIQPITIPALAERRADLRELVRRSLAEHAVRLSQLPPVLSAEAWQLLEEFPWPGNEQQLQRVLGQLMLLNSEAPLTREMIQPWLEEVSDPDENQGTMSLADMERQLIEATFNRFAGNRERTAQSLGIGLRTLSGKLRSYGYPPRGGPGSNRRPVSPEPQDGTSRRAA